MHQGHRIAAILLMSGEGRRFGSSTPKQFHLLKEKKIYRYAFDTLLHTGFFDEIILVCSPTWVSEIAKEVHSLAQVVPGGFTRQQSSYAGLKALKTPPAIVLIHDAVRPFVSEKIIQENIEQTLLQGAINTCIPSTDTLIFSSDHAKISKIPNRAEYLRGQTPQTFLYNQILEAHEHALQQGIDNVTDDCQLILNLGKSVGIVQGSEKNFKITSEFDLTIAEAFLYPNNFKTQDIVDSFITEEKASSNRFATNPEGNLGSSL